MSEHISQLPGKPAPQKLLTNNLRLVTACYALAPDPAVTGQRNAFGTSGHRCSSFTSSFNEAHILATTHSVCIYRRLVGMDGPQ